jgi:hypothetical protein
MRLHLNKVLFSLDPLKNCDETMKTHRLRMAQRQRPRLQELDWHADNTSGDNADERCVMVMVVVVMMVVVVVMVTKGV